MTRLAIPLLKQGNDAGRSSTSRRSSANAAFPGRSEYSASKFAVQGFSEALRPELALDGIDVLVVNPGLTQTNFSKNMLERKSKLQVDHMRGMTSEQVAAATLKRIARGKNEITLTFYGKLMVGMNRIAPWLVDWIAARRVRRLYKKTSEP